MPGYALERKIVSQTIGKTSTFISACIGENGDFVIDGQDIGEAPLQFFGDSDYEYWLTVPAQHKAALLTALVETAGASLPQAQNTAELDKQLLDLTEQLYSEAISIVSDLRKLLEARNIAHTFSTY